MVKEVDRNDGYKIVTNTNQKTYVSAQPTKEWIEYRGVNWTFIAIYTSTNLQKNENPAIVLPMCIKCRCTKGADW